MATFYVYRLEPCYAVFRKEVDAETGNAALEMARTRWGEIKGPAQLQGHDPISHLPVDFAYDPAPVR